MINENNEQQKTDVNHTTENLESVGQMIIGGIEQIGGILTGDPTTRAEGEFNQQAGNLHQEANKNLTAIDENEQTANGEPNRTEK